MIHVKSVLWKQWAYLKLKGVNLQRFLLKTTESERCSPVFNNYGTDVPVKAANSLCFLLLDHTLAGYP